MKYYFKIIHFKIIERKIRSGTLDVDFSARSLTSIRKSIEREDLCRIRKHYLSNSNETNVKKKMQLFNYSLRT